MKNATRQIDLSTHLGGNENMLEQLNIFSIVAYSLVFVLGTIGNGLVIFITSFRMKKTVNIVWILNLAIADLSFVFILLFHIIRTAWNLEWPSNSILCTIIHTILFISVFTSIYLLVVISIDRFTSVWCPLWARNHRTPRLASLVALGVWILAFLLCSPNFKENYIDNKNGKNICINHYDMTYERVDTQYALVSLRFIISFIIPMTVIGFCYGAIVVKLKRDHFSHSSRPFKVITAVTVAFFVCWFPYHVFLFLAVKPSHEDKKPVVSTGQHLSTGLAYFNSCLNPILYFCMGHNFKKKLRCSLLSALVNAFTEESHFSSTKMRDEHSAELESRIL